MINLKIFQFAINNNFSTFYSGLKINLFIFDIKKFKD